MTLLVDGSRTPHRVCVCCFTGRAPVLPTTHPVDTTATAYFSTTPLPPTYRALPPVQQLDGDEFVYTGPRRQHGSTASAGMFTRCGLVYYGKANVLFDVELTRREALSEVCSNDIYGFYGCYAQRLALSTQKWLPGSEVFLDCGSDVFVPPCGVHLMSEWIEGFVPFGPELVSRLKSPPPDALDVTVAVDGRILPVRGLGCILAVGVFINDVDCVGGTAANVGYTIVRNEDNIPVCVQAVKIDPGMAFYACDVQDGDTPDAHRTLQCSELVSLRQRLLMLNPCMPLAVDSLPLHVAAEFMECVHDICSTTPEQIRGFFERPGLEPLFSVHTGGVSLETRVAFLLERQSALADTYSVVVGAPRTADEVLARLKNRYHDVMMVDPVTGAQYTVEQRAANLALLRDANEQDGQRFGGSGVGAGDGEDTMTPAPAVNSVAALRRRKVSLSFGELMARCKGPLKRVNMQGGAGFGKSSCCLHMLSQWCQGKLYQEFRLVAYVPLRHLNSDRYPTGDDHDVIDLICRECLGLRPSPSVRAVVARLYHPGTALWILDGYDEIAGRVPLHLRPMFDHIMHAPHRIVTGRPHAMVGLDCSLDVEVAGFGDEDITEFVSKFFAPAVVPPSGSSGLSPTVVLQYLRRHSLLWDLAHVPIQLVLLCHVLNSLPELRSDTAVTLTELFSHVEALMMHRYCRRQGLDMERLTLARRLEVTWPVLAALAGIAYETLCAGQVMIPGSVVLHWMRNVGMGAASSTDAELWKLMLDCGVLVCADPHGDDFAARQYSFLHLTVHEYFAGKRLAELCGTPTAQLIAWLQHHKYANRLEVMWWFAAGCLGTAASSGAHVDGSPGLAALVASLQEQPREVWRKHEPRLWLRLAEEANLLRLECIPVVRSMSQELAALVVASLTDVLSATVDVRELPWLPVLRDCPRWCSQTLVTHEAVSDALQASLFASDAAIRSLAVDTLVHLGSPFAVLSWLPAWVGVSLRAEDASVRWCAVRVLRALPAQDVLSIAQVRDWLQVALLEGQPCSRAIAQSVIVHVGAVGIRDHAWLSSLLLAALESNAVGTRILVLQVLQALGAQLLELREVVPRLIAVMETPADPQTASGVAVLFARLGSALLLSKEIASWLERSISPDAPAVPAACVAVVLKGLGPSLLRFPGVVRWLQACTKADDCDVSCAAGNLLQSLGGEALACDWVINWLEWALRHPDQPVRLVGVTALSGVATPDLLSFPSVVSAWIATLSDSSWSVQRGALRVLKRLGSDTPPPLTAMQAAAEHIRSHTELDIRLLCVHGLACCRGELCQHPDLSDVLFTALHDKEAVVASAAVDVIKALGVDALQLPWFLTWLAPRGDAAAGAATAAAVDVLCNLGPVILDVPALSSLVSALLTDDTAAGCAVLSRIGSRMLEFPWLLSWLELACQSSPSARIIQGVCDIVTAIAPLVGDRPRLLAVVVALVSNCAEGDVVACTSVLHVLKRIGAAVLEQSALVMAIIKGLRHHATAVRSAAAEAASVFAQLHDGLGITLGPECFVPELLDVVSSVCTLVLTADMRVSLYSAVGTFTQSVPSDACPVLQQWANASAAARLRDVQPPVVSLAEEECVALLHRHTVPGRVLSRQAAHALVAVSKRFRGSPRVFSALCGALVSICSGNDANCAAAGPAALPHLLKYLRLHLGDEGVQSTAWNAVLALLQHVGNRGSVVLRGGFLQVYEAMATHTRSERLQCVLCQVLARLTDVDADDVSTPVVCYLSYEDVYRALDAHPNCALLQESGLLVLRNFCADDVAGMQLIARTGLARVVTAMQLHCGDAGVQAAGCMVMYNLSFDADARAIVLASDALSCVHHAASGHPDNESVQAEVADALRVYGLAGVVNDANETG